MQAEYEAAAGRRQDVLATEEVLVRFLQVTNSQNKLLEKIASKLDAIGDGIGILEKLTLSGSCFCSEVVLDLPSYLKSQITLTHLSREENGTMSLHGEPYYGQ